MCPRKLDRNRQAGLGKISVHTGKPATLAVPAATTGTFLTALAGFLAFAGCPAWRNPAPPCAAAFFVVTSRFSHRRVRTFKANSLIPWTRLWSLSLRAVRVRKWLRVSSPSSP